MLPILQKEILVIRIQLAKILLISTPRNLSKVRVLLRSKIILSNEARQRRYRIPTVVRRSISVSRNTHTHSARQSNRFSANRKIVSKTRTALHRIIIANVMDIHAMLLHRNIHTLKEKRNRGNKVVLRKNNNRTILTREDSRSNI